MPFVSPLLFGSSNQFDAIIEFDGQDDASGGASDPQYNPDAIRILSDIGDNFDDVQTAPNVRFVPLNNLGTYKFTLLQNYSSANINTSLVFGRYTAGLGFVYSSDIMNLYAGSTQLYPSPTEFTFTNLSGDESITIEIDTSFAQRECVGTCRIGIKKL